MIVLHRHDQLDRDTYRRIVLGHEAVALDPVVRALVADRRADLLALLDSGASAYGVTTGLGYLTTRSLAPLEQLGSQRSILVGRASGIGPPLPAEIVRGVVLLRLMGFLSGLLGVSPELCERLTDWLNDGWSPIVPWGPSGAAGETIPLSHLFQTLVGEGAVREGEAIVAADAALARRGVAVYEPGPKEGLALIAGAPFATAFAALLERRAGLLLGQAHLHVALALAVIGASGRPYSERVGRLKEDPGQNRVHAVLAALLRGHGFADALQAPVSFRVAPQVHGAAEDALGQLRAQLERELRAVTDGPVLLPAAGDEPAGLYSTGAFHAAALTLLFDHLGVALAGVGNLVEKRMHRLLDNRHSSLPEQLASEPGRYSGLVTLHKAVVGLCAENRMLAAPASVHASDTSSGQEDVQAFTFLAARKLAQLLDNLELALAYELVVLRQARHLRAAALPPALEAALAPVVEAVRPFLEDRSAAADVQRARDLIRSERLAEALPWP